MFFHLCLESGWENKALGGCGGEELLQEGVLGICNELGFNFKLVMVIDKEWVRFSGGIVELDRRNE